ncbi:Ectoine synthase [Sulfurivirga caldicuralii]|uniref:Ectoine synthase n=1 Tax=Sulfurivirga caldicuralii TaxID=364032 RepID=A0A1N6DMS0_9GAMM|nr:ectoine synthase [Sulfurivirga caldicuralii]SIN72098.1 Ectoine synthase [Sulfurivirga caldicuralii]
MRNYHSALIFFKIVRFTAIDCSYWLNSLVLDKHDEHVLRALEEMTLYCVFNPALTGKEVHNAQGAYEPPPVR